MSAGTMHEAALAAYRLVLPPLDRTGGHVPTTPPIGMHRGGLHYGTDPFRIGPYAEPDWSAQLPPMLHPIERYRAAAAADDDDDGGTEHQ